MVSAFWFMAGGVNEYKTAAKITKMTRTVASQKSVSTVIF